MGSWAPPVRWPTIATHIKIPLTHYPIKDLTGDQLYGMVRKVVEALEVAGFKVNGTS